MRCCRPCEVLALTTLGDDVVRMAVCMSHCTAVLSESTACEVQISVRTLQERKWSSDWLRRVVRSSLHRLHTSLHQPYVLIRALNTVS